MKAALVIANNLKQIMLTAETEEETMILRMITPQVDMSVDVKEGTFFDKTPQSASGYMVDKCKGDYLRAFECKKSLMIIIKPKQN